MYEFFAFNVLVYADLKYYNIIILYANLFDANLFDANLFDANLFDANLFDANLKGSIEQGQLFCFDHFLTDHKYCKLIFYISYMPPTVHISTVHLLSYTVCKYAACSVDGIYAACQPEKKLSRMCAFSVTQRCTV